MTPEQQIWKEWFQHISSEHRMNTPVAPFLTAADQMAFYEIAQPIIREAIEQASQSHTVSNARDSYQYVVRRISESGECFTRKQVGLIESIAVAAEEMGYQRGTEQASQPHWIPVSEQLPPEGEPVLIWMRPETVPDFIHNVIVSNPVFARKQAELGFVTHWMPLPAAPENAV